MGGAWDILRVPQVRGLIERLGYPPYFLVILGTWKLLGAVALVIPRFPRLKEWAYAGVFFDLTGAVVSAIRLGFNQRGCDGIPDLHDRRCSCIVGAAPPIPPSLFPLSRFESGLHPRLQAVNGEMSFLWRATRRDHGPRSRRSN